MSSKNHDIGSMQICYDGEIFDIQKDIKNNNQNNWNRTENLSEKWNQHPPKNDSISCAICSYRQAQAAVLQALPKLKKAGVATRRPEDFLAQMAKSDEHMVRVRSHLLSKQKEVENREKAKKLREMRKRGKKIQQEVLAQRQKEKKDFLQSIKSYKKGECVVQRIFSFARPTSICLMRSNINLWFISCSTNLFWWQSPEKMSFVALIFEGYIFVFTDHSWCIFGYEVFMYWCSTLLEPQNR